MIKRKSLKTVGSSAMQWQPQNRLGKNAIFYDSKTGEAIAPGSFAPMQKNPGPGRSQAFGGYKHPPFGYLPGGALNMMGANLAAPNLVAPHLAGPKKMGKGRKRTPSPNEVNRLGDQLSNINLHQPPPSFKRLRDQLQPPEGEASGKQ